MPIRNSRVTQLAVACAAILLSGVQCDRTNQAYASPHRGGHARHAAPVQAQPQSAGDSGMDQTDNSQETAQEPRATEDSQSRRSDEEGGSARQARAEQPGETLLSILLKVVGMGLLIVVLAIIPTCGTAIVCAIVYHIGNMLRGGQRPYIG